MRTSMYGYMHMYVHTLMRSLVSDSVGRRLLSGGQWSMNRRGMKHAKKTKEAGRGTGDPSTTATSVVIS